MTATTLTSCRHGHENWGFKATGQRYCKTCKNKSRKCKRGHMNWGAGKKGRYCKTCKYESKRRGVVKGLRLGTIANAELRELVTEKLRRDPDLSLERIASRMGWVAPGRRGVGVRGDERRLTRVLGMREYRCAKRENKLVRQDHITEENALLVAEAIHAFPRDIGL